VAVCRGLGEYLGNERHDPAPTVGFTLLVILLGAVALAARETGPQGEQYDLVLVGGRVLDPETALDATRNVGIRAAGSRP